MAGGTDSVACCMIRPLSVCLTLVNESRRIALQVVRAKKHSDFPYIGTNNLENLENNFSTTCETGSTIVNKDCI